LARGDREVALSVADNRGAKISEGGFSILTSVGARPEIPANLYHQLLARASDIVRTKLEAEHPHAKYEIRRLVSQVTDRVREAAVEDASVARSVETLYRSGHLNERAIEAAAKGRRTEEVVLGLARLSDLNPQFVRHAM
jgi:Uncharacterised protein conserved in bacteria (DUF2336)